MTAVKGLTQQRDFSSRLKGVMWGGGARRNKTSAQIWDDVESNVKKNDRRHVSVQRGGAGRIPPPITLPVSSELFRSTVFSSAPYLSNSSLFQTSHREPLFHSSSSVHRSLARSTLADWSSSKRRSSSRPFDPRLWPPWSRRKSAQARLPLMHRF